MKKGINGLSLYVPGTIFIMLGILVVLFPMLLVSLFSAGLILIGITAISVAHRLGKHHRNSHWKVNWEHVDPFVGDWQHRVFARRRW